MKVMNLFAIEQLIWCMVIALMIPSKAKADSPANGLTVAFDKSTPNPDALTAYKKFWDAFTLYEKKKNGTQSEEYQKTSETLNKAADAADLAATRKRLEALQESAKKYRENLASTPRSSHRPFVLINMAQVLAELSFFQNNVGGQEAQEHQRNAILALDEIERDYPNFQHMSEALYLKAALFEAQNNPQAASAIWAKLANSGSDRFAFHACLVLGDRDFEKAEPEGALKYYTRAKSMLSKLAPDEKPLDHIRVYYRLAWAQFKKANHSGVLASIRELLKPGTLARSPRNKEKIFSDLSDLAAASLFSINSTETSKEFLRANTTGQIGAKTALSLMTHYLDSNLATAGLEIAELASQEFALAPEYPDILQTKAKCEAATGRSSQRLETLEKLGMLLPESSLWRQRNSNDTLLVDHMTTLARSASESVASQYYQQGLSSGSAKKFLMAATYYRFLLDDSPTSEKSASIRLNIANCKFFADRLDDAEQSYSELISNLKIPEDVLMTALFQRTLTLEKLWRKEFELSLQKGQPTSNNQTSLARLGQLEVATEDYANRFPSQSRAIDLLLVAASANRDQLRFTEANRFWQRVLLSNPAPGQRAIAIRGIIFTKIRDGKAADIIEAASNFLKLENDDPATDGLRQELLGVIATAASDEASSLSKKGLTEEAGSILLRVVSDFPRLPNRELMWRDGAYFIAISGDWPRAEASAENFLKENFKRFRGDMVYLTARSHEYQLRFSRAVKAYLDLGRTNPEHPRAKISLERAERLALADNSLSLAGQAVFELSKRENLTSKKLALLDTSMRHFTDAGELTKALAIGETRKKHSSTIADKLRSEFLIATLRYKSGEKQIAMDDLDTLSKQIERNRPQLGDAYKSLAADVNMELGSQLLTKFNDININVQKSSSAARVEKKSLLFSELTKHFDKVSSLDLPAASPKARFLVGQAAANFADEITSIPARSGEPVALRNQTRFNQNIARLRDIAQRYHGNNILAKQREPQQYSRNEWISRSALAVSGAAQGSPSNSALNTKNDQLSTASSNDIPLQWSH